MSKKAVSDTIVKMVIVLALLLIILLIFPSKLYASGKELFSTVGKYFGFGPKDTVTPTALNQYLTGTVKSINDCAAKKSTNCLCPLTYDLKSLDRGILLKGGTVIVKDTKTGKDLAPQTLTAPPCYYYVVNNNLVRADDGIYIHYASTDDTYITEPGSTAVMLPDQVLTVGVGDNIKSSTGELSFLMLKYFAESNTFTEKVCLYSKESAEKLVSINGKSLSSLPMCS